MQHGSSPAPSPTWRGSSPSPTPGRCRCELGVTGRWLYSIDDVFVHLLERTGEAFAEAPGQDHDQPAFAKIMEELSPFVSPYRPETWRGPEDAVAREFYRWQAED